jgi:predicted nucleotidyltransferase
MLIDTSHRAGAVVGDEATYWRFADRLVKRLAEISCIESIVLCGSLAKGDVVPGWSDIDLLVFLSDRGAAVSQLDEVADSVLDASSTFDLPLGLDIVPMSDFVRTHQLGGRPLMMTYEVAHYGVRLFGTWPFDQVEFGNNESTRIEADRPLLMRAELHSWRRGYCSRTRDQRRQTTWIFETAKVALRLLQCATGPNFLPRLGSRPVLNKLAAEQPGHELLRVFETAVETRERWSDVSWHASSRLRSHEDITLGLSAFSP